MKEGVRQFLSQLGMLNYYDVFTAKGFDLESDIPYLTSYDLEEVLMITSRQDRAIILSHACTFRPSQEHAIYEWLRSHSLDYYFISFVQSELTDLNKIAELVLPDEDLYDELEIVLPGHRKRLERAVVTLKQDMLSDAKAERPVTLGWWGKPQCLPQAKFDFLCVKASLYAAQEPHKKVSVDFMVDSGSDVSTVQEETLTRLNLELIGPVYSCGIHGGSHTNLYKARLKIGDQEMEIEVMGSNYDSLGSRVVRHFRHIIDGRRHIWLKGTQTDPLPAIDSAILPQAIDLPGSLQTTTSCSGNNLRALPSTELEDDSHSDQNATNTPQDMPGTEAATECSVKSIQPRVNAIDDEHSRSDARDVLHLPSEKGLQDSDANRKDHIYTNFEQPEGDHSMRNEDDNLHNTTSISSQKSHSFIQNRAKSKDCIIRQAVKRKHSCSPDESEHQTSQSDRQPSREVNFDESSLTDSSFVGTAASSSSHTSVPTNERVSLSNLIPSHLRDTDDDIDYMGDAPIRTVPPVCQLPSSAASDNMNNIENSKSVDEHLLIDKPTYSDQHHHSGRKINMNPTQQFPVADNFQRSVFKGIQSINDTIININASNICSRTSSSSALPVSLSFITMDHASPTVANTPCLSRGVDMFTSSSDDIVHIANLGVPEQEEEEKETWNGVSCAGKDHDNPNDQELPYLHCSAPPRKRRNIKMTQNFVQAKGGATLIPLDQLENSSPNDKSHEWCDIMKVTVKDHQLQVGGNSGHHYDLPYVDHTEANKSSRSCKKCTREDGT